MREKKQRRGAAVFEALFLVLFLAGFLFTFLSLYTNGPLAHPFCLSRAELWLLCGAAAGSALLLSLLRGLPRFGGAAAAGAFALFLLGAAQAFPVLRRSARVVRAYFQSVLNVWLHLEWNHPNARYILPDESPTPFLLCAVILLAFLLHVMLCRRLALPALLCTLLPLVPGLLARFSPGTLPFSVLAACWCALAFASLLRRDRAAYTRQLLWGLLPSFLLLTALFTLLPQENYKRPAWMMETVRTLLQPEAGAPDSAAEPQAAPVQRGWTGVADLAHAGPLRYSGDTVLRVTCEAGGRLYLHGVSFQDYADGVWRLDALPDVSDGAAFTQPAQSDPDAPLFSVTVENAASGTLLYLPYYPAPQDFSALGITVQSDACLTVPADGAPHTVACAEPAVRIGDPASETAGAAYRGRVYGTYLRTPDGFGAFLQSDAALAALCTQWAGTSDARGAARAVADALAERCLYDAHTPAAPAGTDPVEWFLTGSRRGYCMHFASAAALILRELGIPARYVSGYTVDAEAQRAVDVPDRAAHAWVEIWLDGFGWYPVEATPAAAFDWYSRGLNMADAVSSESAPEPEPDSARSEEAPDSESAPREPSAAAPDKEKAQADRAALRAVLTGILKAAGAAALLWAGQAVPKQVRRRRMNAKNRNRAALACYRYLVQLRRFGGSVSEEATLLAQKARFSSHTLTREECGALRAAFDAQRARLCAQPSLPRRLVCRLVWGRPEGFTGSDSRIR